MSRLAELLDVSFSNATGIVDRMAERGLVERVRVPDDRRVVLVRIGRQGHGRTGGDGGAEAGPASGDPRPSHHGPGRRVAAALDDIRSAVVAEFGPDHLAGHDHTRRIALPKEGAIN